MISYILNHGVVYCTVKVFNLFFCTLCCRCMSECFIQEFYHIDKSIPGHLTSYLDLIWHSFILLSSPPVYCVVTDGTSFPTFYITKTIFLQYEPWFYDGPVTPATHVSPYWRRKSFMKSTLLHTVVLYNFTESYSMTSR